MKKTYLVVGLVVVGALGLAAWSALRSDGRGGDVGRAIEGVAQVEDDCAVLEFESSGFVFLATQNLPAEWRGEDVPGEVHISGTDDDGLIGLFRDQEGNEVPVAGGRDGEFWFNPACGIWPPDG